MKTEIFAVALAVGLLVGSAGDRTARAETPVFAEIWAFGDSLSDAGNLFAVTGGVEPPSILPQTVPPVTGYNDGRYTDGFLWVERLAPLVGAEIIHDLAVSGAFANANNQLAPLPLGLSSQVAFSEADEDDLVTLWVGANDYLAWIDPATTAQNSCLEADLVAPNDIGPCTAEVVGDIVEAIGLLHEGGARTFLIGNLPDLAANPFVASLEAQSPGISALLGAITPVHNATLAAAIADLRDDPDFEDASFTLVDMFTGFGDLAARPDRYGLVEAESPCVFRDPSGTGLRFVLPDTEAPFEPPFLCPLGEDGSLDSTGFLYWDQIHPSRDAHDLIGLFAFETLRKDLRWPARMKNREEKITKRALNRLQRYARTGKPAYEILEADPILPLPSAPPA